MSSANRLQKWTGLTLADISPCVKRVQDECFQEAVMDHREEKLKAVAERFERHTKKSPSESGFNPPTLARLDSILHKPAEVDAVVENANSSTAINEQQCQSMVASTATFFPGAEIESAVAGRMAAARASCMQGQAAETGMTVQVATAGECGGSDSLEAEMASYAGADVMDEGSMDGVGIFSGRDITNTLNEGGNMFAVLKRGSDESEAARQQTPFTSDGTTFPFS